MANDVTCRVCRTKIPRENAIIYKKAQFVCSKECLHIKEEKDKNKNVIESEPQSDFRNLTDYLQELYGASANFPALTAQVKRMLKENPTWKYSGILATLKYIYEIKEIPFDSNNGIGLVEYMYEEAREHYIHMQKCMKAIKEFDWDNETEIKEVYSFKKKEKNDL